MDLSFTFQEISLNLEGILAIMRNPNWNPDDYTFDFQDDQSSEGSLANMPIIHKVEKLRLFFTVEVMGEIQRCLTAKAELSALILCLASID